MIRCEVSGPNGPTIGPRWPAFGGESRPPSETTSFLPIITLAIIFGLSSDYEMFVVSRIKEDYTKHGDARRAVPRGTGKSARVVTAAALIMFSIFVAFVTESNPPSRHS